MSRTPADVRQPAVAGMFYPGDAAVLSAEVDRLLAQAKAKRQALLRNAEAPIELSGLRAIIVPHAGYIYSGAMAAEAYNVVAERVAAGERFDRVIVVGPTHRVPVFGLAYPSVSELLTPLGAVPVWPDLAGAFSGVPDVAENDATHRDEHAIEVQLPFLQKVLPGVPVAPLNAGQASGQQVANVVDALLSANDNTLLVISSDLSHYLHYDDAIQVDAITLGQILSLAGPLISEQACGATPINGVMELARRHDWFPLLLGACNSGDTAGDKTRVVGYCAIAFYDASAGSAKNVAVASADNRVGRLDPVPMGAQPRGTDAAFEAAAPQVEENSVVDHPRGTDATVAAAAPLVEENSAVEQQPGSDASVETTTPLPVSAGPVLLANARAAIEQQLGAKGATTTPQSWGAWANKQFGVFVTLTKHGALRGCIGTLTDDRPLRKSVPANAINAAIHDPRFPPLTAAELSQCEVEVSVLSQAEPVLIPDGAGGWRAPHTEAEAAAALVPGVDGIILRAGWHQATFLPQVWEQLPDPVEFLAHLRAKAGLPARAWGPNLEMLRYRVQAFEED